jgi:hypothetical protein
MIELTSPLAASRALTPSPGTPGEGRGEGLSLTPSPGTPGEGGVRVFFSFYHNRQLHASQSLGAKGFDPDRATTVN